MTYGYGYPPAAMMQPAYHQPRHSAPPSVHVVAIFQYLGGLSLLAVGAVFGALAAFPDTRWDTPGVRDFVTAEDAPMVAAILGGGIALAGLIVMVFARKLQRGRQWARVLMMIFCTLSVAGGVLTALHEREPGALAGLFFPVLYLLLLNTRAARSWFSAHTW